MKPDLNGVLDGQTVLNSGWDRYSWGQQVPESSRMWPSQQTIWESCQTPTTNSGTSKCQRCLWNNLITLTVLMTFRMNVGGVNCRLPPGFNSPNCNTSQNPNLNTETNSSRSYLPMVILNVCSDDLCFNLQVAHYSDLSSFCSFTVDI